MGGRILSSPFQQSVARIGGHGFELEGGSHKVIGGVSLGELRGGVFPGPLGELKKKFRCYTPYVR